MDTIQKAEIPGSSEVSVTEPHMECEDNSMELRLIDLKIQQLEKGENTDVGSIKPPGFKECLELRDMNISIFVCLLRCLYIYLESADAEFLSSRSAKGKIEAANQIMEDKVVIDRYLCHQDLSRIVDEVPDCLILLSAFVQILDGFWPSKLAWFIERGALGLLVYWNEGFLVVSKPS